MDVPSSTTPPGSAPGPRTRFENFVDRHSVRVGAWLLRRTRGRIVRLWGRRALVLTTTGRRTGLPRTVVVQYFPDGRDFVVVAANSGMPTHPAWYLNLTDRSEARVEVEGRQLTVRAAEMPPEEAADWWPRVLATAPDYARYPQRAGRRIPLLRLVPVDDAVSES
jgi:F420H(2)-dependent quinone reductase